MDVPLGKHRGLLSGVLRLSVSAGCSSVVGVSLVAEARDKVEAHSIVKLVKGEKTNLPPIPYMHTYSMPTILVA